MCATCGCSESSHTLITDMQNGRHLHLHAEDASEHGHDHQHAHHQHQHDQDHHHGELRHSHAHSHQVDLQIDLLARNNLVAERNRGWFAGRDILALNLMSSPGAGKTTLLERMITDLQSELNFSVIEGDQASLNDGERIRQAGCRVIQVNTGAACHLDAAMVAAALRQLNPPLQSTVLIENVGNLVCPAMFDLGERARVVVASVPEGDDKPQKYPHMFRTADIILLNKIDLLPHVRFNMVRFIAAAKELNREARVFPVSAAHGSGLEQWYGWLRDIRIKAQ